MKKNLFGFTPYLLITVTPITNTNWQLNFVSKKENRNFHLTRSWQFIPESFLENWYKFLATNDWKISISRYKWENLFLSWMGDGLMGITDKNVLYSRIYQEIKTWRRGGNRNFDSGEYWSIVNYIIKYKWEVSRLFYTNSHYNLVTIATDSDVKLSSIYGEQRY